MHCLDCKVLVHVGKDETKAEKLRSILSQLEYKYKINLWQFKGVPFKDHMYVPEVHPVTGPEFCEREDEGHIFKVNVWLYKYYVKALLCIMHTHLHQHNTCM